jgi:hypothetical protein
MMRLDMLTPEQRRELYQELSKEFSRNKDPRPGLKEAKLAAASSVIGAISGFSTYEQRQILDFARDIVMTATKRFQRDSSLEAPTKKPELLKSANNSSGRKRRSAKC